MHKRETIRTGICRKFSLEKLEALIDRAGMKITRIFSDPMGWFSLAEIMLKPSHGFRLGLKQDVTAHFTTEVHMCCLTRIISILISFVFLAVFLTTSHPADAEKIEKVVFGVSRFDTGQQTLENLEGVKKVYTGFRDFLEVITVYYDPDVINVRGLENALKEAGLYRETIHDFQTE